MKVKNIKEIRIKRKLTQDEASKKLGITKEYLSMIERGIRNPSDTLKYKFAELYNVSVTYIFLALKETNSFKSKNNL